MWNSRQLFLPVRPEHFSFRSGQQVRLPADKVLVLITLIQFAQPVDRIEIAHFLQNERQRPEIADDVMDGEQNDLMVRSPMKYGQLEKWPVLQVEGNSLRFNANAQLLFRPITSINDLKRNGQFSVHSLQ